MGPPTAVFEAAFVTLWKSSSALSLLQSKFESCALALSFHCLFKKWRVSFEVLQCREWKVGRSGPETRWVLGVPTFQKIVRFCWPVPRIQKCKFYLYQGQKSCFWALLIKVCDRVGTPTGYYILWANCREASSSILQFWQVNRRGNLFYFLFVFRVWEFVWVAFAIEGPLRKSTSLTNFLLNSFITHNYCAHFVRFPQKLFSTCRIIVKLQKTTFFCIFSWPNGMFFHFCQTFFCISNSTALYKDFLIGLVFFFSSAISRLVTRSQFGTNFRIRWRGQFK